MGTPSRPALPFRKHGCFILHCHDSFKFWKATKSHLLQNIVLVLLTSFTFTPTEINSYLNTPSKSSLGHISDSSPEKSEKMNSVSQPRWYRWFTPTPWCALRNCAAVLVDGVVSCCCCCCCCCCVKLWHGYLGAALEMEWRQGGGKQGSFGHTKH